MAEYIDKEACLSILRAKANMAVLMDAAPYFEKAAQMLEKLPAADVAPVVRCKDCDGSQVSDDGEYIICCRLGVGMGFDDFCSCGERKEEQ